MSSFWRLPPSALALLGNTNWMLLEALQQKGSAASSLPKPNAETSQQLFFNQVGAFTLTPGEKRPPGKTGEDTVVSKWNHSDYSTKGPSMQKTTGS